MMLAPDAISAYFHEQPPSGLVNLIVKPVMQYVHKSREGKRNCRGQEEKALKTYPPKPRGRASPTAITKPAAHNQRLISKAANEEHPSYSKPTIVGAHTLTKRERSLASKHSPTQPEHQESSSESHDPDTALDETVSAPQGLDSIKVNLVVEQEFSDREDGLHVSFEDELPLARPLMIAQAKRQGVAAWR